MYRKGPGRVMIKLGGKDETKTNGFTIIEVVLVLAIAGLIFLVVFLALPALQKSQRDNARKQDVAKVIAGLQNYLVDNNNQPIWYMLSGQVSIGTYFSGLSQANSVYVRPSTESCVYVGTMDLIAITSGCKCSEVGTGVTRTTNAKFANVQIRLENDTRYCQDI